MQDGVTALHLAAQGGKVDVVRLLIDAQAQVNIQSEVAIYIIVSLCHIYTVTAIAGCLL